MSNTDDMKVCTKKGENTELKFHKFNYITFP